MAFIGPGESPQAMKTFMVLESFSLVLVQSEWPLLDEVEGKQGTSVTQKQVAH